MKKIKTLILSIALVVMGIVPSFAQENELESEALKNWTPPSKYIIDTRIDNMGYWGRLAELGLVPVAPETPFNVTTYTGNEIYSPYVMTRESTDVPTTTVNSTQSENSIVVDPMNNDKIMNSNNSTQNPVGSLYGANFLYSTDGGTLWGGTINGAGGTNQGDPTTGIDRNGRYLIGFINSIGAGGQSVSWSTNQGTTWTPVVSGVAGSQMLDKNHMWIDVSATSPYVNNAYNAWTNFGLSGSPIEISRTTNGGLNWSTQLNINSAFTAGSHNQGVNICTGPAGQVYVFWAVYESWPSVEGTYAFAKSTNGGTTYAPAVKFLTGCRGIRSTGALFHNMRTNSFPSSCCDISGGAYNGTIYMIWPNNGVPGVNTGSDIDVYLVKSTNEGANWSTPTRVTNDALGNGKKVANPWITCDPVSGALSVVFYDDRNCSATQAETWVANSVDGGATWDNFKVSDVAFTPGAIPGLAGGYMGDYLGITARAGKVYPCWSDNRSGKQLTYVSPYTTGPPPGQPFVNYNAYTLNDPTGNNNHQMDYAENNTLTLAVKNIGDQTATNTTVVLSTTCPFITITDNTESYGNIAAGAIVSRTDAYAYTVANNIPDGTLVTFVVTATDNTKRTYISNFVIEAHAPALSILSYTISDPLPGGNNNGKLDPNESADVIFSVSNPGDWDVTNVTGTLSTTNSYVTVTVPTANLTTMTSGQTKQATHHVTVSNSTPLGSSIDLNYSVTGNSGNYTAQRTFIAKVGLNVEDWETNTFTKFPWVQDTPSTPWTITNVAPYEQVYCAKSGLITHSGSTSISVTYARCANDSISFYKKVSSEATYDYLKFYIDGTMIDQWSGDIAWSRSAYPVTLGTHTFKWEYMKDGSVNSGSDCAWTDYIVFPAQMPDVVKETPIINKAEINCYPNPFSGISTITYKVEKTSAVTLKVYNSFGKEVAPILNNQITNAGTHKVMFNSKGLPQGIYFVVYTFDNNVSTIKVIVQ